MTRRPKLLTGLSSIALTGTLAIAACSKSEPPAPSDTVAHEPARDHADADAPAVATGGESEGAALVDVAHDKAAFYSALQIVRGHLLAGKELYLLGDREMGPQHLRHPQAEILTTLAPALEAAGGMNIVPSIDALATAGENGAAAAEIESHYAGALSAISFATMANNPSLKEKLLGVAKTLSVAGDEYSIGVKNDAVDNLHEYHDAYGFIATALDDLKRLHADNESESEAIRIAIEQTEIAAAAAPSIHPPTSGFKPASVIYGAAARIEIAARGL